LSPWNNITPPLQGSIKALGKFNAFASAEVEGKIDLSIGKSDFAKALNSRSLPE